MKKSPLNYAVLIVLILSILSGCFCSCSPVKQKPMTQQTMLHKADTLSNSGIAGPSNCYYSDVVEVHNTYTTNNLDNINNSVFINIVLSTINIILLGSIILLLLLKKNLFNLNLRI